MAIKPFEAAEKRKTNQKEKQHVLSSKVENAVTKGASNYNKEWWIGCEGFEQSVIDDVIKEYRKAGWDIRIENVDGICIVIKENLY